MEAHLLQHHLILAFQLHVCCCLCYSFRIISRGTTCSRHQTRSTRATPAPRNCTNQKSFPPVSANLQKRKRKRTHMLVEQCVYLYACRSSLTARWTDVIDSHPLPQAASDTIPVILALCKTENKAAEKSDRHVAIHQSKVWLCADPVAAL